MTTSPHDALREALAESGYLWWMERWLQQGNRPVVPWLKTSEIARKAWRDLVDTLISGPIAARVASLEAERDAAVAEVARLREALERAEKLAKDEKSSADMYAKAWVRELGGKLIPKAHHIDACVRTTRWMRERSDRLAVIEADQKAAALIAEYGPSNEMIRARAALRQKDSPDA